MKCNFLKVCGVLIFLHMGTILVMGGSLGAKKLNDLIVNEIDALTQKFRIIHLTGHGKKKIEARDGYVAYEFVSAELKDLYSITDAVVARSGANSIFEFLALNKPMLLVPLELGSRGDQLQNAKSFVESGYARLKRESELQENGLVQELDDFKSDFSSMIAKQQSFSSKGVIEKVLQQLEKSIS